MSARNATCREAPGPRGTNAARAPIAFISSATGICDAMREGRAEPIGLFVSVFWIRLYGVLVDLRNHYRKLAEAYE